MRNEEAPVRGIAGKAAADVVENAAAVKLKERLFRHGARFGVPFPCVERKEKHEVVRGGEFRRMAKAAVCAVKRCVEIRKGPFG